MPGGPSMPGWRPSTHPRTSGSPRSWAASWTRSGRPTTWTDDLVSGPRCVARWGAQGGCMNTTPPEGGDEILGAAPPVDQNASDYTSKGRLKASVYEREMERIQEQ